MSESTPSPEMLPFHRIGSWRLAHVCGGWPGQDPPPPADRHRKRVPAVAVAHDGSRVVSGSADGTARVWDAASGTQLAVHRRDREFDEVVCVALSTDGSLAASGWGDNELTVWDPATGDTLHATTAPSGPEEDPEGVESRVTAVAFSPDGERLACGCTDAGLHLISARTGDHLHTFAGHTDGVDHVRFSPDGARILSADCMSDLRLWDASGQPLHAFDTGWAIRDVAFADGGDRIVARGFDAAERRDLDGHTLAPLPDGTTADDDHPFEPDLSSVRDAVAVAARSADGRTLAAGTDRGVVLIYRRDG